jgi:two-component system OmpR family sensor kinase
VNPAPSGCDGPERLLLRRARRVITVNIALVISVLVIAVGALAYVVMASGQQSQTDRMLNGTIEQGISATPPGCLWLFSGQAHTPVGAVPAGMPIQASIDQVTRDGATITERVAFGGEDYTVRTEWHGGVVVQAFFDERYQVADRNLLLIGLAAAEVIALLAAAVTGHLLAGRAIYPLGDALRRQRTFVADASHELRAPLTRLHARAQLLSRRAGNSDPGKAQLASDDLDRLVLETRELGEVVEDLLLSARLRTAPPQLGPVELGTLAEEAIASEAVRAQERGLRLVLRREQASYMIRGVPTALRRVLSALLDNAIGHTPAGGLVEITVRAAGGRHVELSVRDTGSGFEQRDAERIFERFARGDNGDGRRFGLGLALVREVVAGHGGTISARGEPDNGATFTLRFRSAPT